VAKTIRDVKAWSRVMRVQAVNAHDQWLQSYMFDTWDCYQHGGETEVLYGTTLLAGMVAWVSQKTTKSRLKRLIEKRTPPQVFAKTLTAEQVRLIEDRAMVVADRLTGTLRDGNGNDRLLVEREELDRVVWILASSGHSTGRLDRVLQRLDEEGAAWIQKGTIVAENMNPTARYILKTRAGGLGQWWCLPVHGWAWIDGRCVYLSVVDAIADMEFDLDEREAG
jgi:hypothetical protein